MTTERPSAVLVTGHYLRTERRVGFHWLAGALHELGFSVTMMTTGISWLSVLRRDHRMRYGLRKRSFRSLDSSTNPGSIVWFTPWHPGNLRLPLLNRMAGPLYRRYGKLPLGKSEDVLRTADLLLFDTAPGLMLVERAREMNPNALLLLRASDDLRAMKQHETLLEADRRVAPLFDDISVPSAGVERCYERLATTHLDRHGLAKGVFDSAGRSPYDSQFSANAVFVGTNFFDYEFLSLASAVAPEIAFHIVGPISGLRASTNVFLHGELPFEETVPYIVHADIGLHTVNVGSYSQTSSDSLKTRQYAYAKIPIVCPSTIRLQLPGVSYYDLNASSVRAALTAAIEADPADFPSVEIDDWTDLANRIVRRGIRSRLGSGRPMSDRLLGWSSSRL